jgi:mannitol-1-/sugar-/sorbitol-6-phosphatase
MRVQPNERRRLWPVTAWGVVTSGIRSVAEFRLRHTGLPSPAVMICADDITRGKPDPEGYLTAAARLGYSAADCIVIEDAPALSRARLTNVAAHKHFSDATSSQW